MTADKKTTQSDTQVPVNFADAMTELEQLNAWFQRDDLDLEAGLEKLQRARVLIHFCQKRLGVVENEFTTLRQSFDEPAADDETAE